MKQTTLEIDLVRPDWQERDFLHSNLAWLLGNNFSMELHCKEVLSAIKDVRSKKLDSWNEGLNSYHIIIADNKVIAESLEIANDGSFLSSKEDQEPLEFHFSLDDFEKIVSTKYNYLMNNDGQRNFKVECMHNILDNVPAPVRTPFC